MEGAFAWQYDRWDGSRLNPVAGMVIAEALVRIHVNGQELATFMCTPRELDRLALGFLRSEGFIQDIEDVRLVTVCPSQTCVDVWLRTAAFAPPSRPIVTSGCGGGITFDDLSQRAPAVTSQRRVSPEQISDGLRQLLAAATLYRLTRGVHTSALSDGQRLLAVAEDVGRHNTIDKLWGACLLAGLSPAGHILLATGRISSEMLNKAAKMQVPIVASRTSPTSLSVRLAEEWNMTLLGYVRGNSFNVYSGAWRLLPSPATGIAQIDEMDHD